jgi:hypothetical protein
VLFPGRRPAAPHGHRPARARAVHVHRRARGGPAADPEQAAGRHHRLAVVDRAALRAGGGAGLRALPGALRRGPRRAHRAPARVRALPRRRDVDHGVPGAGADPHRTPHAPHPGRRAGARLRGDRRRGGVVAARRWSSRSRWAARWRASARSCCSPRCTRW